MVTRRPLFVAAFPVALALSAFPVLGAEVVFVGDSIAVDQPRVLFAIEDPADPGVIVGPDFFNDGLLDTGANGILLSQLAYFDFDLGDFDPDMYEVALRPDLTPVQYEELGVAGTSFFDVLKPYNLSYQGSNDLGAVEVTNVNMLGAPDLDTGSFAAVLGMPLMTGRTVHLDLKPVTQLEFMGVAFVPSRPAATANTYTINLSSLAPEFPGQQEPSDPLPTFHSLPLVDITTHDDGLESSETVLLDTGGQLSIISVDMALDLGMILDPDDPNTDILGSLEVGGIGGTVEMPIVEIDRLVLQTNEGIDLVLTGLQVGVLEIPGLGGVLGMNALTSGYGDLVLGEEIPEPGEYGVFGDVYLDFTSTTGVLQLEMNPLYNIVVPEPTGLALLLPGLAMLLRRRRL